MRPADALAVAWQGVTRRPLRALLTGLMLTLGVVSLMLVVGSGEVVRRAAVDGAILRSGPAVTVTVPLSGLEEMQAQRLAAVVAARLGPHGRVSRLETLPSLSIANDLGSLDGDPVEAAAVDHAFTAVRPLQVTAGEWQRPGSLAPDVVLNRAAADDRQPGPVWLTWAGLARPVRAVVTGQVVDGHDDPRAYLSTEDEDTLAALGLHPEQRTLLVSHPSSDEESLRSTVRDVADALHLQAALGDIVRSDELASYDDQLATVRVVFSALAVASLVVAMVGLLNIGLAALRERTQEFALRRALGATGTDLAVLVLCESQMIAVLGSAVAIPIAWAGLPLVLSNLGQGVLVRPDIPVSAMVVGVLAGALAALLGSLAPAARAARVPIAGVLR